MKSFFTWATLLTALLIFNPTAQAQQLCSAPTNVTVNSTSVTTAVVSWSAVASAVSYTVRYYWTGDSTAAGITTVNTPTSPVTLSGLRSNGSYVVRVSSNCQGGGSSSATWQYFVSGGNGPTTCYMPTNLVVSNIGTTSATVSFTPIPGALSYTVQYSLSGTTGGTSLTVMGSPVTLTGLTANTSYIVRVSTNCTGGNTSGFVTTSFRTASAAATCNPVTNLHVSAITATSASVSFTPLNTTATYSLQYYPVSNSSQLMTQTTSASPVGLSSLQPNTRYLVQVRTNCSATSASPFVIDTFRTASLAGTCGAVTNITVTATGPSTAVVNFTPGAGNTLFTVTYYSQSDSTNVHVLNPAVAPVVLTGLVTGQNYVVQVRSYCGNSTSGSFTGSAPTRFSFRPGGALGSRAALGAGVLSVYPNPAHRSVSLALPAVPGATQAQLSLLNAVGQQVRNTTVALMAAGTQTQLDLTGVAPGLYTVRVSAGGQTASQRVVVE